VRARQGSGEARARPGSEARARPGRALAEGKKRALRARRSAGPASRAGTSKCGGGQGGGGGGGRWRRRAARSHSPLQQIT
jgi:hypothetical protein